MKAFPAALTEVPVTKGEPHKGQLGRVDLVCGHIVLDWKTDSLDVPNLWSRNRLDRRLDEMADQVESYVRSRDLPQAEVGIIFFEFPPVVPIREIYIESRLRSRGIGVLWGPRY